MSDGAIRSVAILGDGLTGLSAACAFARALPQVAVTLVRHQSDPTALADRLPDTLPGTHHFHRVLGLEERDLVRAGAASQRIATRFAGWPGEPWFFVHGEHGRPAGSIGFRQLWAMARLAGNAEPYDRHSAAGVLASAGKFVHPQSQGPFATFDYTLQVDPDRYRAILGQLATHLRVARAAGDWRGCERREDGGIAALLLEGGDRVEADLFLDCAGPAAPLLSAVDPAFESWRDTLPGEHLLLLDRPAPFAPDPVRRVEADAGGWRWVSRLPDREIAGSCSLVPRQHPGMESLRLRIGRRPAPWQANVLAIGDAAAVLGPLHGTSLHLAQTAILRALELLPGRDMHPLELANHNRRAADELEALRDFLALHYAHAPFRPEGYRLPPGAATALRLFTRRARLPLRDEQSYDAEAQAAALFGLGVLPDAVEPLAMAIDPAAASRFVQSIAAELFDLAHSLPNYREYLLGS